MEQLQTEEIEYHDWEVTNFMSNNDRLNKSITSYYLNIWYPFVENITFKTYIYPIISTIKECCPLKLPFENCMVRYENKSPKDSELWVQ